MSGPKTTIKGLLITVGLTPEACIWAILKYVPENILWIVSATSIENIDKIRNLVEEKGGVIRHNSPLIIEDEYDLEKIYERFEKKIPVWVNDHNLQPSEVMVDITGGTKSMVAALVLYTANYFSNFAYSARRERDANEEIFAGNPLEASLTTHYKRWRRYSQATRYRLIAEEIDEVMKKLKDTHKKTFCSITLKICQALASYDRFENINNYIGKMSNALSELKSYQAGADKPQITEWYHQLTSLEKHFQRLKDEKTKGEEWIYALIANAKRRAEREHKYEDAVARLYSALERIEKLLVLKETGEETSKFPPQKLPQKIKEDFLKICPADQKGNIKFGLDKGMRLLEALGNETGKIFCSKDNPWRGNNGLLTKRNYSIMAHGFQPVSEKDYIKWWDELKKLWNYDEARLPVIPDLPEMWW